MLPAFRHFRDDVIAVAASAAAVSATAADDRRRVTLKVKHTTTRGWEEHMKSVLETFWQKNELSERALFYLSLQLPWRCQRPCESNYSASRRAATAKQSSLNIGSVNHVIENSDNSFFFQSVSKV